MDNNKFNVKNILKRKLKKLLILITVISMVVILFATIFFGTVKNITRKAGEVFADIKDKIQISGNNLEIDQDYLTEGKRKLKTMGISASTLGLTGNEDYLDRFLEAEVVTSYPYLGGDGLQGTVYFERAKIDGTRLELKYMPYDEFYSKKNDDDIYNYFTVDTNDWTAHVKKNDGNIEKIDYQNMVSKFAMPFEFPIILANITHNPQFCLAVVKLVKKSKMVVTIAESKTTTTTTERTNYKLSTELHEDDGTVQKISENVDQTTEPTSKVDEDYSTVIFLSRAQTWIANVTTELTFDDSTEKDPTIETPQEDRTSTLKTDAGTLYRYEKDVKKLTDISRHYQRWTRGNTKVTEKTKNFTNLILRDISSTIGGDGILEVAKNCHDAIADSGRFTYGATSAGIPIDVERHTQVDCSGYVSWVLYEAGYEEMAGGQHTTSNSSLGAFGKEKGWEVIKDYSQLEPGDICFWRGTLDGNDPGHVNIFVETDGKAYYFYDCGSTSAINAKDPIQYNMSEFGYAFRPNDEIAQSLSTTTKEKLEEKINKYIEGLGEGPYSVSVIDAENLDTKLNINSQKVKSDGWLKLFIMATAYDDMKKGNIEEDLIDTISTEIEIMITSDDNTMANKILEQLGNGDTTKGIKRVNEYLKDNSYGGTKLKEELKGNSATDGSDENYTRTSNVAELLNKIFNGKCVNKKYSDEMKRILQMQSDISLIPSQVDSQDVGNKTGRQLGIVQDAAMVSIENANYIVVISASNPDTTKGETAVKDIASMVNAYFVKNGNIKNNDDYTKDDEIKTILNGRRVCYRMPDGRWICPLSNLVEGREMMFDMLADNERTQSYERLMRYLLYLLTGNDYGVTEFDFNEFLNGSFSGTGGAWTAIWGNGCTREEFIAAVKAFSPPNVTGNGGRSAIDCYNKYFVANAENFYDICTKNGMDPRFIFCIGIHESYFGTSNIANTKGNFFGWGAYDWDPGGSAVKFADMSAGIEDVSSGLKQYVTPGTWQYQRIQANGYDPGTIDGIGSLYASDPNWATAVKQHMTNIFGMTGDVLDSSANASDMQKKIVEIASSQDTLGNKGGYCQAWVADVYAKAGQSRSSKACASEAANAWVVSKDKNNIPLGACVYGHSYIRANGSQAMCGGHEAGHVGIYIGDGKVASNVGGIKIESLDSWTGTYGWKGWGWNGGTDYSKK